MLSVDCPGAMDDNRTASGWERSSAKGRGPCASVAAHQSHFTQQNARFKCYLKRAIFVVHSALWMTYKHGRKKN